MGKKKSVFAEYFEAIFIALILALVIRTFLIQAFVIPSESMLDTILIGDRVLVNKFSYGVRNPFNGDELIRVGDPEFGDIIVFPNPETPQVDYIKRVIGLPGDTIEVRDKVLYRNGRAVQEDYVRHSSPHMVPGRDNFGPVKIPEGEYFCMGDNRDNSHDSRFWGTVPRNTILGKAFVIYWSSTNWFRPIRWGRIGMTFD